MGTVKLAQSPFEQFATDRGYDITPAVSPSPTRIYADARTQEAYDNFQAGAKSVARIFFDSTFETEAFREKMRELAGQS